MLLSPIASSRQRQKASPCRPATAQGRAAPVPASLRQLLQNPTVSPRATVSPTSSASPKLSNATFAPRPRRSSAPLLSSMPGSSIVTTLRHREPLSERQTSCAAGGVRARAWSATPEGAIFGPRSVGRREAKRSRACALSARGYRCPCGASDRAKAPLVAAERVLVCAPAGDERTLARRPLGDSGDW